MNIELKVDDKDRTEITNAKSGVFAIMMDEDKNQVIININGKVSRNDIMYSLVEGVNRLTAALAQGDDYEKGVFIFALVEMLNKRLTKNRK